ncbi:MAG: acetyl-CoA carboxylase biotin carboxylase subunit [Planctomycetota bacterium]|nr:acetyl-CoA carboxylase biotin carboxylase subunit [Planctomycetota bacterium]
MFSRILIANRGEIALRVIRACKEMGIETVAVYSERDADAIYLRYADETVCIGPSPSHSSYLDIPRIISAAEITDVEAIHPGYGFLAENPHFAEVCRSCGIEFIGPSGEAIKLVGDKSRARELARSLGVPIVPGSKNTLDGENKALKIAQGIGFPVIIKAAMGGGGRGMRVAHNDISLINGYLAARAEAAAAFNDSTLYLEKYIERPRHVEFQILADREGNVIHLGERDCSLQRRHQKLIEESPCPILEEDLRRKMGDDAVKIARAAGYTGAGTVEFLLDPDLKYYFIEMNARIQVEHPVTEMVTGLDLVKEQIKIAAGQKLKLKQEDVTFDGVSIECRINAEDPAENFKPSPGKIGVCFPPGGIGVRVDTHIYSGFTISSHYDSLIAKVIVHRKTRGSAIRCMRRALDEFVIEGIKTTIPMLQDVLSHLHFIRGEVNTGFIEEYFST